MIKVEHIIERYGWPDKTMIGYGTGQIIWLVLHHQNDLNIRDEYEPLVVNNMGDGAIEAYQWRSENLRRDIEFYGMEELVKRD